MSEPIPTPRCDNEVDHASNVALYITTGKHGYTEEDNAYVVPYVFAQDLERETIRLRAQRADLAKRFQIMLETQFCNVLNEAQCAYFARWIDRDIAAAEQP